MGDFFVFILKSSICIALFFLFYKLLLSRETFHRLNRILLLSILSISVIIPFVNITLTSAKVPTINFETLLYLQQNISAPDMTVVDDTNHFLNWLLAIYLAGVLVTIIVQAVSLTSMLMIIKNGVIHKKEGGITLVVTQERIAPFSWINYLVISEEDLLSNGEEIITHEEAHIRKKHSFDIIISQFIIIFQWFNPASYLLKQELQSIHEFEADEAVINKGIDAKKYQLLLIKKAVGARLYSMANSFNHSKLKKRITMMIKEKSNKRAALKALFILPLSAIAIFAFASEKVTAKANAISKAEITEIIKKDTTKKEIIYIKSGNKSKITVNGKEVSLDSLTKDEHIKIKQIDSTKKSLTKETVTIIVKQADTGNQKMVSQVTIINKDKEYSSYLSSNFKGLIVLDGIEKTDLQSIDPDQISSMTVLKGASAIKLYGDKGKEGVVIITTKGNNTNLKSTSSIIVNSNKHFDKALFIVDDKITEASDVKKINSVQIEAIKVLKGKEAIEKYGDKGKDGVIIIKTKKLN